jgi:hypothetical protein
MDDERVPKPSRSESEERRRRCALRFDIEVEVATVQVGAEGAGTGARPGAHAAATLAAKFLGFGNLVGPYPGLCITIDRGHMLCPADRGHRRLSAPSGSLGRTLFEILYMDFREFPFYALR